jgi:uncharacterized protein (UPF0332 family)
VNLEAQDKRTLSDLRMAKAKECLEDARANRWEGRHKTAVNRAFFAALSAIRSLLILEGSNPETHEGVITMLSLRFVKPDLLPVAFVKSFKLLQSRRADVDYGDIDTIGPEEAADAVQIAEEMIQQAEALRKTLLSQSP